jgi:small subunit ribosomal protein S6
MLTAVDGNTIRSGRFTLAENVYEAMFIFDSNRFARDHAALPGEVEQMIKTAGGNVLVSRLWEERRLAYPICGQRKGTYWLVYFRSETSAIEPVNRQCAIHDGILRQLILQIHPHLVDAVLEHAQAGPAQPAAAEAVAAGAVAAAAAVAATGGTDKEEVKEEVKE